ncbi:A disintegrin and metalloproteinase with thrombospondin motifs like [Diachasmimorpha longicaudata]|uniref:A disintegrin and metalloproteinase with thrombospondin motifs like n=1 Tax=Diachasmimorpha longicaudata TaxID=58733 RepID=UPI0030B8F0D8
MQDFKLLIWVFAALYMANGVHSEGISEDVTTTDTVEFVIESGKDGDSEEGSTLAPSIQWPNFESRSADAATGMYLDTSEENIALWLTDSSLFKQDTPIYSLVSGDSGPIITKYSTLVEVLEGSKDFEKGAVLLSSQERDNSSAGTESVSSKIRGIPWTPEPLTDELTTVHPSTSDESSDLSSTGRQGVGECSRHHRECIDQCGDLSMIDENADGECGVCRRLASNIFSQCPLRPGTIYPRLLVVVDYSYYVKFNKRDSDIITYLLGFWNGVDLKYRFFENPKIRMNIVGIVLTKDTEALHYMKTRSSQRVDIDDAMNQGGHYWYARNANIPIDSYDVIVTMTSNYLCEFASSAFTKGKYCRHLSEGVGESSGACAASDDRLLKLAIVNDNAEFRGIRTAAHKIGHTFGIDHDSINGENGCSFDNEYVMASDDSLSEHQSLWSNCSLRDFQIFLDENPTCFNNKMDRREILPVYLPGKILDVQEQCHRNRALGACHIDASICRSLKCKYGTRGHCAKEFYSAADGSTCATEKICLNGKCVDDPTVAPLM